MHSKMLPNNASVARDGKKHGHGVFTSSDNSLASQQSSWLTDLQNRWMQIRMFQLMLLSSSWSHEALSDVKCFQVLLWPVCEWQHARGGHHFVVLLFTFCYHFVMDFIPAAPFYIEPLFPHMFPLHLKCSEGLELGNKTQRDQISSLPRQTVQFKAGCRGPTLFQMDAIVSACHSMITICHYMLVVWQQSSKVSMLERGKTARCQLLREHIGIQSYDVASAPSFVSAQFTEKQKNCRVVCCYYYYYYYYYRSLLFQDRDWHHAVARWLIPQSGLVLRIISVISVAFEVGGTKVATLGTANLVMENSVGQTAGVSERCESGRILKHCLALPAERLWFELVRSVLCRTVAGR